MVVVCVHNVHVNACEGELVCLFVQVFMTAPDSAKLATIIIYIHIISTKSSHFCHCSVYMCKLTPSVSFSHSDIL